MTEHELREYMAEIACSFYQRGYATGAAGNLSLRLDDGSILATPTGSSFAELDPQTLSKVSISGHTLSGLKPSKEVDFHLQLYKNNPECQAVVHLHCHYLTALSCLQNLNPENVIQPCTPYVVMRVGKIPLIPYFPPGDQRIGQIFSDKASLHKAFLLANHGPVVTGKNLRDAVDNLEEMEAAARLFFTLEGHTVHYLNTDEIEQLRREYA